MTGAALVGCSSTQDDTPSTESAASESAATSSSDCDAESGYSKITCLSNELIASADADLASSMVLDYSLDTAEKWSNFPPQGYRDRVGPTLSEFSPEQLALVMDILKEASGTADNEGYDEIQQILNADDYLAANATGQDGGFGSGNFHFAFLGTPSDSGTWELYYGGHHTAFANTYTDGVLVGATPSFRGVEPGYSFDENDRSNMPMEQERVAFANLVGSLTPEQQAAAKQDEVYTDILVGPQKDGQFPATQTGVPVSSLSPEQKALVVAAMNTYVSDIDDADAATILAKYTAELDNTYVAFSGTAGVDQVSDYVRIDGPSVWIEFVLQAGASLDGAHPHSVWRDKVADYGGTE
ncbi:DUF3500 domain-containing protein [Rhodococcoides fascians A25f]|uniref:DUF3500 domain-containing protein n=1 Tax=Rhodococcoides fascians TaxID=1828 RepID=UPI0009B82A12|nr:DUF3500 domain-containing protein [Rhodococcus fascians]QII07278.1 DUF3500 domain-containing protein [Rhodococcus fascians A25f]